MGQQTEHLHSCCVTEDLPDYHHVELQAPGETDLEPTFSSTNKVLLCTLFPLSISNTGYLKNIEPAAVSFRKMNDDYKRMAPDIYF